MKAKELIVNGRVGAWLYKHGRRGLTLPLPLLPVTVILFFCQRSGQPTRAIVAHEYSHAWQAKRMGHFVWWCTWWWQTITVGETANWIEREAHEVGLWVAKFPQLDPRECYLDSDHQDAAR